MSVQEKINPFFEGMTVLKDGGRIFPLRDIIQEGIIAPYHHVYNYYNVYHGGGNPFIFSTSFMYITETGTLNENLNESTILDYDYIFKIGHNSSLPEFALNQTSLIYSKGYYTFYKIK